MHAFSTAVLSLLAVVPLVAGHGYVASISVDGKTYQGNTPNSNSGQSFTHLTSLSSLC